MLPVCASILRLQIDLVKQMLMFFCSDRGSEYLRSSPREYSEDDLVEHNVSTPYTPQQNGVAERLNRTSLGLVQSMLQHKRLGKEF